MSKSKKKEVSKKEVKKVSIKDTKKEIIKEEKSVALIGVQSYLTRKKIRKIEWAGRIAFAKKYNKASETYEGWEKFFKKY